MNKILGLMGLLFLSSVSIAAADCLTESNGLEFNGVTAQDAVYGCQTSYGTNQFQCRDNVRCEAAIYPVDPRPYPGVRPVPIPGPRPVIGPRPIIRPPVVRPGPRPIGPIVRPGPGRGPGPRRDEAVAE